MLSSSARFLGYSLSLACYHLPLHSSSPHPRFSHRRTLPSFRLSYYRLSPVSGFLLTLRPFVLFLSPWVCSTMPQHALVGTAWSGSIRISKARICIRRVGGMCIRFCHCRSYGLINDGLGKKIVREDVQIVSHAFLVGRMRVPA